MSKCPKACLWFHHEGCLWDLTLYLEKPVKAPQVDNDTLFVWIQTLEIKTCSWAIEWLLEESLIGWRTRRDDRLCAYASYQPFADCISTLTRFPQSTRCRYQLSRLKSKVFLSPRLTLSLHNTTTTTTSSRCFHLTPSSRSTPPKSCSLFRKIVVYYVPLRPEARRRTHKQTLPTVSLSDMKHFQRVFSNSVFVCEDSPSRFGSRGSRIAVPIRLAPSRSTASWRRKQNACWGMRLMQTWKNLSLFNNTKFNFFRCWYEAQPSGEHDEEGTPRKIILNIGESCCVW